jgi:hypothetical protein
MLVLVTSPLIAFATVATPTDVESAVVPPSPVRVRTRVTVSVTVVCDQPRPQGPLLEWRVSCCGFSFWGGGGYGGKGIDSLCLWDAAARGKI